MIQEKPDITLVEIRERLNKKCCIDDIYNMVNRLGMTFKKKAVLKYSVDTISTFSLGITR